MYDDFKFIPDRHQPHNSKIINYRYGTIGKMKKRNTLFCNALIKRIKEKKLVYYKLNNSQECIDFQKIIKDTFCLLFSFKKYIYKI